MDLGTLTIKSKTKSHKCVGTAFKGRMESSSCQVPNARNHVFECLFSLLGSVVEEDLPIIKHHKKT